MKHLAIVIPTLSERLNEIIEERGLSLTQIREKTKVSALTLSDILHDRRDPRLATLEKLAHGLRYLPVVFYTVADEGYLTIEDLGNRRFLHGKNIENYVGNVISKYRNQARLTREELASKLKIKPEKLKALEHGNTDIPLSLIEQIADKLLLTPYYLFKPLPKRTVKGEQEKDEEDLYDKALPVGISHAIKPLNPREVLDIHLRKEDALPLVRGAFLSVLARNNYNVLETARDIGITNSGLYKILRELGIRTEEFDAYRAIIGSFKDVATFEGKKLQEPETSVETIDGLLITALKLVQIAGRSEEAAPAVKLAYQMVYEICGYNSLKMAKLLGMRRSEVSAQLRAAGIKKGKSITDSEGNFIYVTPKRIINMQYGKGDLARLSMKLAASYAPETTDALAPSLDNLPMPLEHAVMVIDILRCRESSREIITLAFRTAVQAFDNNITHTAAYLGMQRQSLHQYLVRYANEQGH